MKPLALAAVLALALASCSDPPEFAQAKTAVAAQFGYPSGVEFRHLRLGSYSHQVCGEAKGRLAGAELTDFRRFSWRPGQAPDIEGFGVVGLPGDESFESSMAKINDTLVSIGCD